MKKRVVMTMIGSMAFAVTAWGAEMEYSGTWCGIQKRNVLYSTSDLTVLSVESWGIQPSQPVSRSKDFPDSNVAVCNSHAGKYTLP